MHHWPVNSYHLRQYDIEYESTKNFYVFLMEALCTFGYATPNKVLDVGCGGGSNTRRISQWFPSAIVEGIDNDAELIAAAKSMNLEYGDRLAFKNINLFDISPQSQLGHGIVSIQTLSWIPTDDIYAPIKHLLNLEPDWICFSSLGFEGKVDAKIQISDFSGDKLWSTPYNILSNEIIAEIAEESKYHNVKIKKYVPNKKLVSYSDGMSSYTREFANGEYAIFSGPLFLPWFFYFIGKEQL